MANEVEEMRAMIGDARRNFLRAVEDLLLEGERLGNTLAAAVGEVSPAQALDAWKRHMVKRLSEPTVKCDGNHAGPRCADPECWNQ